MEPLKVERVDALRLFYAVRLPPELAGPLLEVQKRLRSGWRLVPPEQFHLTLAFMATVLPSEAAGVEQAGEAAVAGVKPFTVALTHTDCFPDHRRPRVLVVHAFSPELGKLAGRLKEGLKTLDQDTRPFRGHLTVARAKGPEARLFEAKFSLSWTVDRLELVRSTLTKSGAEHVVIRTFNFA